VFASNIFGDAHRYRTGWPLSLDRPQAALNQPQGYSSPTLTKMGSLSIGAG